MKIKYNQEDGFIVGLLMVLITITSFLLLTISSTAISNYQSSVKENARVNAQLAADSGLDQGIQEINLDETWGGTTGEVILYNNGIVETRYEVLVSPGANDDEKIIRSTGNTYSATTNELLATRIFELEARAVTTGSAGAGVVSGIGGLVMNNNSKITGGDVIVGGTLYMKNQAQIGLSTTPESNAVNLRIAHYACPTPADATYPELCGPTENGEPITMENNAKIYADVKANNQISGVDMINPGLTASTGVPKTDIPVYERSTNGAWGAPDTPSTESTIRCGNNNDSKIWPANTKIIGTVDMKNNCTITVHGDIWITGDVITGNKGRIVVPDSVGLVRPVIMIDGASGFTLENNGQIIPNSFDTGVEIRTFWSEDNCTTDQTTPCSDLTGVDLKNSQDEVTIELGNNGQASNSIFVAQWSRVRVSNNGVLGALAGQSIELSNQAVINFSATLPGSDNLLKTWVKRGYLRVYQ